MRNASLNSQFRLNQPEAVFPRGKMSAKEDGPQPKESVS